eukprot:877102-Karenia_brevis.AAC.1
MSGIFDVKKAAGGPGEQEGPQSLAEEAEPSDSGLRPGDDDDDDGGLEPGSDDMDGASIVGGRSDYDFLP